MRQGDDDTECLSIEIVVGNRQIRCVAGYGPQLGDSIERKDIFGGSWMKKPSLPRRVMLESLYKWTQMLGQVLT